MDDVNKAYVRAFESGVGECYPHTMLKSAFVTSEVNDIMNPASFNSSWNTGISILSPIKSIKRKIVILNFKEFSTMRLCMIKFINILKSIKQTHLNVKVLPERSCSSSSRCLQCISSIHNRSE